jgi:hypothetical protein
LRLEPQRAWRIKRDGTGFHQVTQLEERGRVACVVSVGVKFSAR